ncbi:coiled-coil domain-containing protein 110 [Alligator mississippiensis]|uniref:coiled-coil domain-containing protein 110 n=1 Tax=Alligator mississippiensis TaxID=8496 RepID=UPI002877EEE4|nr:coiled-coil domain-containing protein 110 [Alligator mississippiensis]
MDMSRSGADKYTPGTEIQIQPQSALKIFQQQLDSFQALRQQTLENVNMVQSEISEILNKSVVDVKTSQGSSKEFLMTSSPAKTPVFTESPQSPFSMKEFQYDQKLCTHQPLEASSNIFLGNVVGDVNISHQISLKTVTAGKIEKPLGPNEIKTMNTLSNEYFLKDFVKPKCFLPCTSIEAATITPANDKLILDEPKAPLSFLKYDDELHLTDFNYSTKQLKQELQKPHERELGHASELKNVSCGQYNDSEYMLKQDPKISTLFLSCKKLSEDSKSIEISKPEETVDKSHITLVSLQGNNLNLDKEFNKESEYENLWTFALKSTCSTQEEAESKNKNEFYSTSTNSGVEGFQFNVFSKTVKDKLQMLDHIEQLQREKEDQLHILSQRILDPGNPKFSEIKAASEYSEKIEVSQNSSKYSEHLQNKMLQLENENITFKAEVKHLTVIIQSLREKSSKYEKQIKALAVEKQNMKVRLVKSEEDSKECIKEVKRLLRKCKEFQNQKKTLQEQRSQLCIENQCMRQALDDFKIKNQEAQEQMIAATAEKDKLTVVLDSLQKESLVLREVNRKLETKTSQLIQEKASLEKELVQNQVEIKQLKEKENVTKSEQETLLQSVQLLKEKKFNLEMALQECANVRQMQQKELEKVQSDKTYAEEKLLTELRNAKAEIDFLKINLANVDRDQDRLSVVVRNITEENRLLKKEIQDHKLDVSKYQISIGRLNEDHLLMENHVRTIENERDVLQFEVRHLQKDYINLQDQITALVNEQCKYTYTSGSQEKVHSTYSMDICEEISDYKCTALVYNPQGVYHTLQDLSGLVVFYYYYFFLFTSF